MTEAQDKLRKGEILREPGAEQDHRRKLAPRTTYWLGGQGHQWSLWHASGMSEREKAPYSSCRCTIKHSLFFFFPDECSLSHFHHFDYNTNKCLIKCNSLSLGCSLRWKHSHIKLKNSNMAAGMTFCWNYVSKSCFSWCSMSVCYILGTKLTLYRAFVWFFFLNKINVWKKSQNKCKPLCWQLCKFLGASFQLISARNICLELILVLLRLSPFRKEFLFPFLSHTYTLLIRASRGTHRSLWLRKKKMACHSSYPSDSTERKFILVSIETKQ